MAKNVANLKDGFYTLSFSTNGTKWDKVEHLQKCGVPSEKKVLDEVTATDDNRVVKAPVNFFEEGEVEFEYVLDPDDLTHKALQTAYSSGAECHFKLEFKHAPSESRQFKGIIADLTTDNEDTKKKIRKQATITITGEVLPVASVGV